jgi:Skp family chaperone for outer membrane proteins
MKTGIKWTMILFALLTQFAFAADDADSKKKEHFQKAKAMAIENIEGRIDDLQKTKSCISSASDREAIKSCRSEAKKRVQAMREKNKAKRKEFKEKRSAEKEKRKSERKAKKEK